MAKKKLQIMVSDELRIWYENESKRYNQSLSSYVNWVLSKNQMRVEKEEKEKNG